MNCTHEWSSGIYGLAYRCKKCNCLPSLDVAHHVALERVKDIYNQLTSARSRIKELEKEIEKRDAWTKRDAGYSSGPISDGGIDPRYRHALSGKDPGPKDVSVDIMALKEIVREAIGRYDRYTANVNMTHEGTAQMVLDSLLTKYTIKEKP